MHGKHFMNCKLLWSMCIYIVLDSVVFSKQWKEEIKHLDASLYVFIEP